MQSGSAGNDPVGDAAEILFKRLINVTGDTTTASAAAAAAASDAPAVLVRAQIEGGILLERLRRASPQGRAMMGAVLKRLVFESYNTRAAVDAPVGAVETVGAGESIPPLPLSVMPPIEPDVVKMLAGAGRDGGGNDDIARDAAARSAGALSALSVDTHLELMEAGVRAPLVSTCGAAVLEAGLIHSHRPLRVDYLFFFFPFLDLGLN